MALALFSIGIFGVLGLTILCPVLAFPLYLIQRLRSKNRSSLSTTPVHLGVIEVLIPAHNEEASIVGTLQSVRKAIDTLRARDTATPVPVEVIVHVATDGCSDQTATRARSEPGVRVSEALDNRGKWATLKEHVAASSADWIFLADAGTLWPETLLVDVVREIRSEPRMTCAASSYRPANAGLIHHLIWDFELSLKSLERVCGGPVSVHGSTVSYRASALKTAFDRLGDFHWINDDVVVPLTLRALDKDAIVGYPVGSVVDGGFEAASVDLGRRRRMLMGNLQWVGGVLGNAFRLNAVAGVLALRRLFRMLWAYWGLFLGLALVTRFPLIMAPVTGVMVVLGALSGSFRQTCGAAFVSLTTPFLFVRSRHTQEVLWK